MLLYVIYIKMALHFFTGFGFVLVQMNENSFKLFREEIVTAFCSELI